MVEAVGIMDERKARCSDACVSAKLMQPYRDPTHVHLTDVGLHGCRVSIPKPLTLDSFVTVVVKDVPSLEAWVAWSLDNEAGLSFAHKPPPSVIAGILAP